MTTWGKGLRWLVAVAAIGAPMLAACGSTDQGTGSSSISESQSGGAIEYGWLAPLPGSTTGSTGSSSNPCDVSRTDPSWSIRCGADAGTDGSADASTSTSDGAGGAGGAVDGSGGASAGDGAGGYNGCGSPPPPASTLPHGQ